MGQERTWEQVHRAACWPGMKGDVVAYFQECDSSQQNKKLPGRTSLWNTDILSCPLDFCRPLHKSVPDGMEYKMYVLAIQDVFSRYCVF